MTDSMLTIHDWQRWGYDYRLPDIWPPRPSWGTVEQTKVIEAICKQHNIPWGFHDNYIDIYPDADDFSYKFTYFRNQTGDYDIPFPVFHKHNPQPNTAWYNKHRDAQSYKFRPDCILPFVKRNYERILQDVHPTASFVDVLSAVKPTDWYDSDGNYHSMVETRQYWGEAFATIRNMLGGNAHSMLCWYWYASPKFSTPSFLSFRRYWRPNDEWHSYQITTPIYNDDIGKARERLRVFLADVAEANKL